MTIDLPTAEDARKSTERTTASMINILLERVVEKINETTGKGEYGSEIPIAVGEEKYAVDVVGLLQQSGYEASWKKNKDDLHNFLCGGNISFNWE